MNELLKIDGFKQIVEYGSIEPSRTPRITSTLLLSDGGLHYHNPGLSNEFTVSFTTFIKKDDVEQIEHFNQIVLYNQKITVISEFGNFPSGEYYITKEWSLKHHSTNYYSVDWEVQQVTNDDTTTEFYQIPTISTSDALTADEGSISQTEEVVGEGCSDKNLVRQLQQLLKQEGYYVIADGSTLIVDGVWGEYTTQALQLYQQSKGLKVTGTLTTETKEALSW